jgi:hypothetical protein
MAIDADHPIKWTHRDEAGLLPEIISPYVDITASEQIADGYAHGGGYCPQEGFKLVPGPVDKALLQYPGDLDMREISRIYLPFSCELVILFEHDFVCIVPDDGEEGEIYVTRMD